MDEISVFRRFFVASSMIQELLGNRGIDFSGMSGTSDPGETPAHLGSSTDAPIHGMPAPTRRQRTVRRGNVGRPNPSSGTSAPSESYNFPS